MKFSNIYKKVKKKLKCLLLLILVFLLMSFFYLLYNDKKDYDKLEKNMYITNSYKKIWVYNIWERIILWWIWESSYSYNSICNIVIKKCLRWNIEGIKIIEDSIYVYIMPKNYNLLNKKWRDSIFEWWFYSSIWNIKTAKIFWIFTQKSMNFYSINDLKKLWIKEQNILLNLKEEPKLNFD